jgi:hypothetical protein
MALAVVSETSSAQGSDVNTHTASLPGTLGSGNLLILAVVIDGASGTITPPTGWSDLITGFTNNAGGNNVHGAVWYKVSEGNEGSTVTFDTLNAQRSVHKSWQISGHDSGQAPQGTGVGDAGTASNSADPPSVTPTGGAKDYLWLAVGGKDRGGSTFTGFPANYTNTGEVNQSATDTGGVCIAWGRRALNASSEDPAAFTFPSTVRNTVAMTIAVHPAAAGAGGGVNKLIGKFGGKLVGKVA